MSLSPSNSDRLEETLESTRRNVRQLEIDAYRIRTDLTRLEVALEDGVGTGDAAAAPRHEVLECPQPARLRLDALATSLEVPVVEYPAPVSAPDDTPDWQATAAPLPEGTENLLGPTPEFAAPTPPRKPQHVVAEPSDAELSSVSILSNRSRRTYRYATPPVMASLFLHGSILLLIVSITVATIVRNEQQFGATILDLGEKAPDPLANLDLDKLGELDDAVLQNTISDSPQFDVAGPLVDEVTPVDFQSVAGPTALGDMGSFSSVPLDLGMAMTGVGGLGADGTGAPSGLGNGRERRGGGGARNGGRLGSALFFGTESKGDRFVFVVDNSSSMKGGRLEMAISELVKCVGGLTAKQLFYVIFVSDQTYPMFYPLPEPDLIPATPPNKKRLVEWLPKAILASGKNREMIKAMDMAAALRPHAVYLLWDGDLRYSEKVRLDVMTHLTQPNQWKFVIHTLGMGISSLDSEQNLSAIALAHGGIYRRIDVPNARPR